MALGYVQEQQSAHITAKHSKGKLRVGRAFSLACAELHEQASPQYANRPENSRRKKRKAGGFWYG